MSWPDENDNASREASRVPDQPVSDAPDQSEYLEPDGELRGEDVGLTEAPIEAHAVEPCELNGELLADVQNDHVGRWLAYSKASRAVERRQPSQVARRRVNQTRRQIAHAAAVVWRADRVARARLALGYHAPLNVLRLTWFVIRGHARWIAKVWTFLTYGDLLADARAARLAGDVAARRTAQELIRADSRARWARVAIAAKVCGAPGWPSARPRWPCG